MPKKVDTPKELLGWLSNAKGRSELIVACVIDIRGFSAFSKSHESPELAMYIKGFYTQTIQNFFPTANFAKPTGDGLLLTFTFEPETLNAVSEAVFKGCFELLKAFPTICKGDAMVNFPTPTELGIGIARGPACCLHSGNRIIDYSGHFLNLAARLMDLARPNGIVVDGNFLDSVIPRFLIDRFGTEKVYLRGISEEESHPVFYLKDATILSDSCLHPLVDSNWKTKTQTFKVSEVKKLANRYELGLDEYIKGPGKFKVTAYAPHKKVPGHTKFRILTKSQYLDDGNRPRVWIPMDDIRKWIAPLKLKVTEDIRIAVDYIPKTAKPKKPD